jgi:uncharacterized membrane protein YjfL (UPF0719 family)
MEDTALTSLQTLLPMNAQILVLIAVNFVIAVIILAGIKFVCSRLAHVRANHELTIKDTAFATTIAGVILGVVIIMSGVMTGEAALDLDIQSLMIAGYGALGIVLLSLSRFIFDKIAMPKLDMNRQILRGNMAAALMDFSNVIASALIVRAVMFWVNSYTLPGLWMLLAAFVLSQMILTFASYARMLIYQRRYGSAVQTRIGEGNIAVALQFGGYRIAVALAIMAASKLIPYAYDMYFFPLVSWLGASLIMIAVLKIVAAIGSRIILFGIDTAHEVDVRANAAVGVIQGTIYVALGFLISSLMV